MPYTPFTKLDATLGGAQEEQQDFEHDGARPVSGHCSTGLSALTNQHADSEREKAGRAALYHAMVAQTRDTSASAMDASADAPLRIGNLRSAKSDKPIVAIGIEGSANKVRETKGDGRLMQITRPLAISVVCTKHQNTHTRGGGQQPEWHTILRVQTNPSHLAQRRFQATGMRVTALTHTEY